MKFRKEIIEKKKIRQAMGILLAVTMLLAGTPYTAVAADRRVCLTDSKRSNNEKGLYHLYVYRFKNFRYISGKM